MITKTSTTIDFHGDDILTTLKAHTDFVRAVYNYLSGAYDVLVTVHAKPRITDSESLKWDVTICGPTGRKTVVATQRIPAGSITFAME